MTRSEERIDAIEREIAYECACATSKKLTGKDEESERNVKRMGLLREVEDILLAEQKREAGCDYCNGVIVARNSLFGIYQSTDKTWHISTDESDEDLYYCPKCGKRLPEGESV